MDTCGPGGLLSNLYIILMDDDALNWNDPVIDSYIIRGPLPRSYTKMYFPSTSNMQDRATTYTRIILFRTPCSIRNSKTISGWIHRMKSRKSNHKFQKIEEYLIISVEAVLSL